MPWSPLIYEKEILSEILEKSLDNTIRIEELQVIIMRQTKLVGSSSIAKTIRVFERLGYISKRDQWTMNVNRDNIEARIIELSGEG